MLTETYLEGKFVKERNIDLLIFEDRVNNFIAEKDFSCAKICSLSPVDKGVSFTLTNRVSMNDFKFYSVKGDCLIIEFEEFKNAITINESANVCLDLMHDRILFKDFGLSIYFSREV